METSVSRTRAYFWIGALLWICFFGLAYSVRSKGSNVPDDNVKFVLVALFPFVFHFLLNRLSPYAEEDLKSFFRLATVVVSIAVVLFAFGSFGKDKDKVSVTPTAVAQARIQPTSAISATPTFTPTNNPTNTPNPTATMTPSRTASSTPRPSNTPRPTNTPVVRAIVNSDQNVFVRSDANTNSDVIAVLLPNASVTIDDQNDDGSWVKVTTSEGLEGWMASFLLQIQQGDVAIVRTQNPVSEATRRVTSTPRSSRARCPERLWRLGGIFRVINSYEASDYVTYSYDITTAEGYEVLLSIGSEWEGIVFPMTIGGRNPKTSTINDIRVDYLYEGTIGEDEGLFFSFEYGEMKFSGDVSFFGNTASSEYRDELMENLEMLILAVKQKCE